VGLFKVKFASNEFKAPNIPISQITSPFEHQDERKEWIKQIRLLFSRRQEFEETQLIVDEKGLLNQE
jgi:hypothetical protein